MEPAVYILCTATALACAVLLLRGFRRTGVRLLLWTGLFFLLLSLENALLFVDRILVPSALDLTLVRASTALIAVVVLLYGLIWEKR
jgi:hypothetical protein